MDGVADDFSGVHRTSMPLELEPFVDVRAIPIDRALASLSGAESEKEFAKQLSVVMAMLWSDVSHADLLLRHPSGDLRSVRKPSDWLVANGESPFDRLPRSGSKGSEAHLSPADSAAGRGPAMTAPIFLGGTLEGRLVVARRTGGAEFGGQDLDALMILGNGIQPLLKRIREQMRQSMSAWADHDMTSARELQRSFLPNTSAGNSAGVRAFSAYLPAFAVGGDFFDVIDLGDGRILATMGDVTGKGVTAALLMARLTCEIRRLASETASPSEFLRRLNRSFAGQMQDHSFATMVCVLLDTHHQNWVVSNAGHVLPILRRGSGWVSLVAQPSGSPIGISRDASYHETVYPALPRDILILSTDGALDALSERRGDGSFADPSRLVRIIKTGPHDVVDLGRKIMGAVESVPGVRDDIALLGLQLPG